jgi:peptidyl-prolyl cis-trans isomerase D
VAIVGDQPILARDFQRVLQNQRFRLQSSQSALGASLDLDEAAEKRLKQETLAQMVNEEVMLGTARARGMAISDEQLAAEIQSVDIFLVDGKFSPEQYERWVRSQGYVTEGFEEVLRRSLLVSQLQTGVGTAAFLTGPELGRVEALRGQTRTFSYLTVPAARFLPDVQADEQAIEAYYRDHREEFVQPEEVDVEYVAIGREALADGIAVADEEVRQRYEAQRASYRVPEQRRARHILLGLQEGADDEAVTAATAKAREILERMRAGESFEDLARAHSEDPGSAQRGGDLGLFARGVMVGPFEEAVFAMQAGDLSEPVRTPFGIHLIRLDEVQPESTRAFEEVAGEIRREIQLERTEGLYFEQAERLANLAFEHPDSLEPAAQALGLTVQATGFFGRAGGVGPAAEPKLVTAAFSESVLAQGHNSEPVELRDNRVVVLRVREHRPASQRTLEEVRAEVERRVRAEAAKARAAELARAVEAALASGQAPDAVAAAHGLEWREAVQVRRTGAGVDPAILERAFRIPRPEAGAVARGHAQPAGGDAAVILLREVKDGADAPGEGRSLSQALGQVYGQAALDAMVESLRRGAKVEVFDDQL